jgi:hypothetical protein
MRDARRNVLERAGDDEAAIGKPDQNDVAEILVEDVIDDVADVGAEAHQWAGMVNPFANAGQARRRHVVLSGTKQPAHVPETVRAAPSPVNQNKCCHANAPVQI